MATGSPCLSLKKKNELITERPSLTSSTTKRSLSITRDSSPLNKRSGVSGKVDLISAPSSVYKLKSTS